MARRHNSTGAAHHPRRHAHTGHNPLGFTLVEAIVVLVLLGLGAALVAPALIFPEAGAEPSLNSIVSGVQDLAARRGETLELRVSADGGWHVESAGSPLEGVLAEGRLEGEFRGPAFALLVSAIGTCGPDVRSSRGARYIQIDPLTCRVGIP